MKIKRKLVGAIVLTTLTTSVIPAFASQADTLQSRMQKVANSGNKANANVTQNYEVSVESAMYNLQGTIKAVDEMKAKGTVTQEILGELATQITTLDQAVSMSGKTASSEVIKIVQKTEEVVQGLSGKGAIKVSTAIIVAKQSMSINTEVSKKEIQHTKAEVNLTDIQGHWGKDTINFLVGRKAISGYPDGTFKPDKAISRAEFVTLAIKAANGGKIPDLRVAIINSKHWAVDVFNVAIQEDILRTGEIQKDTWDKPISRYEMAMVAVRVIEYMLKENRINTNEVAQMIADYSEVQNQVKYTYYVEQAFMKGIVSGMDVKGTYMGAKGATRAEASVVVSRILDASRRKKIEIKKISHEQPITGRLIYATDPNRPLIPKEGDVFVKLNGAEIVLKVGPSGVLGEGQGIAYHRGIVLKNGHVFKGEDLGTTSMGHPGETYLISKEGEGHFNSEWHKIRKSTRQEIRQIKNPQDGQIHKNWWLYHVNGSVGQWYWMGPDNGIGGSYQ
ncbi:MAG: S-layer homology domain-containing protein [Marinisporobacter sp.]|nr:S-layer homology domain-containing protein [Marinisporobacter sp.]